METFPQTPPPPTETDTYTKTLTDTSEEAKFLFQADTHLPSPTSWHQTYTVYACMLRSKDITSITSIHTEYSVHGANKETWADILIGRHLQRCTVFKMEKVVSHWGG